MNSARRPRRQLGDLRLDACRRGRPRRSAAARSASAPAREIAAASRLLPSPMLRITSTGFWVRKRKPRSRCSSSSVELERAERSSLRQVRLEPLQQLLLEGVLLALAGRSVATAGAQLLEPLLDDRQVGHRELQVQLVDVPPRVGRRRQCRVVEGARHVQERVRVADLGEQVGLDGALPGGARRGSPRRRRSRRRGSSCVA